MLLGSGKVCSHSFQYFRVFLGFLTSFFFFLFFLDIPLDKQTTWIATLVYGLSTVSNLVPRIATIWEAPPPGVILSDPTMVSLTKYQKCVGLSLSL